LSSFVCVTDVGEFVVHVMFQAMFVSNNRFGSLLDLNKLHGFCQLAYCGQHTHTHTRAHTT